MTEIRRRQVLIGLAGAAGFAGVLKTTPAQAAASALADIKREYLSATGSLDGGFNVVRTSNSGEFHILARLPQRQHQILVRPGGREAVSVDRRAGRSAWRIGLLKQNQQSQKAAAIGAGDGRHFYGHGAFSPDGRYLFTSENAYDEEIGVIGIRDAGNDYGKIAEWPSRGVGPHQILITNEGPHSNLLVVANGGILTHPDTGRVKHNIADMSPSIAWLDIAEGSLVAQMRLPGEMSQLSIRHIAAAPGGRILFGLQDQAYALPSARTGATQIRPLVGLASLTQAKKNGKPEMLFDMPKGVLASLKGYIGSVATDPGGRFGAASAPRGNIVIFLNLVRGAYIGHISMTDICGVAAGNSPGRFFVSTGEGVLANITVESGQPVITSRTETGFRWDNHLTAVVRPSLG